jgi:ATP-dependent DNA helicase RecG
MKGIGPRRAEALAAEGITSPADLLRFYPRSYIDRNAVPSLRDLRAALLNAQQQDAFSDDNVNLHSEITVVVFVKAIRERTYGKNRSMIVVELDDNTGVKAEMVFWNQLHYFKKLFEPDQLLAVSGIADYEYGKIQFHHPEIDKIDPEDAELYRDGQILPKYRLSQKMKDAGLTMRIMRSLIATVIDAELPNVRETLSDEILRRLDLPNAQAAIRQLHFPESRLALERARQRMKFEELFFFELLLALRSSCAKTLDRAPVVQSKSPRARAMLDSLPFKLTSAQARVIREIAADMGRPVPMNRLLQGDVGSGKTIVALLTMLMAIDSGYQCALMAPTEILAEQHYNTLRNYTAGTDIVIAQLVGGQKTRARREILERIAAGTVHIIVGTHALFQSSVVYHRLGMVVIDEQHRFGVVQRAELKKKATESFSHNTDEEPASVIRTLTPHILVMSATPIPRTLSMTLYGDLDVSIINELPQHRKPIKTKVVFESRLPDVFDFIAKQVAKGFQAYIVYPLVEKSDKVEAKSAVEHFEYLQHEVFPHLRLGLLHGQMLWYEKEDAMKAFKNKEFDILVATTVVEVGIDVPNATVMLIENAERFGLAQLHQLRGRVGRGAEQSYCLLATKDHFKFHLGRRDSTGTTSTSERKACILRLKTMQETTDGFAIAEMDLRLRGPGDVMGTRQSGLPEFVFTDLASDGDAIAQARQEAFSLIADDPHLRKTGNACIREEFLRQYRRDVQYFDVA